MNEAFDTERSVRSDEREAGGSLEGGDGVGQRLAEGVLAAGGEGPPRAPPCTPQQQACSSSSCSALGKLSLQLYCGENFGKPGGAILNDVSHAKGHRKKQVFTLVTGSWAHRLQKFCRLEHVIDQTRCSCCPRRDAPCHCHCRAAATPWPCIPVSAGRREASGHHTPSFLCSARPGGLDGGLLGQLCPRTWWRCMGEQCSARGGRSPRVGRGARGGGAEGVRHLGRGRS